MCVRVGPGIGEGEGASEQMPESVRGLGLGSWGTVARDDVGELTVEITLCCSQPTSSVVGGVVVATPRPHPSLFSSSSGVRSERKSCMRRSVVAGSLS